MLKILLVEDHQGTRDALRSLLKLDGHEMTEASDGWQALQSVQRSPPDVILLDLMMPGMGGGEFLQILRSHPQHWGIPVIATSALGPQERAQEIDGMKVHGTLVKGEPQFYERLSKAIRDIDIR